VTPALTQKTTARIYNAINPYGLVGGSDGMLYASGATIEGAFRKLAVWRFGANGEVDPTFGTNGVVSVEVPGVTNIASFDLAEVTPNNFLVHGVGGGKVWLTKLTKNGNTGTWGTPTEVKLGWTDGDFAAWTGTGTPSYGTSWGFAIDKTNAAAPKIVVFASGAPERVATGTQRTVNDRWIARVSYDTLVADPAFNGGKAVHVDIDAANLVDNARRGVVGPDGAIYSSGYTPFPNGNVIAVIKVKADGTLDAAFNAGTTAAQPGVAKYNPFTAVSGGFAESYALVLQSTGRVVTSGYGITGFDAPSKGLDLITVGLKGTDGTLDPTFGRQGVLALQSELDKGAGLGTNAFQDRGRALAVLPDDRTIHVGSYDSYAAMYLVTKDGKLDTTSGHNGILDYGYPGSFHAVAISADGKKIAATTDSLVQTTDAGVLDAGQGLGSVVVTLDVAP